MRPIKFRAFNKQNGMMDVLEMNYRSAPDVLCRFDYDKDGYQEARFTNSEQATKDGGKKACVVMQFTGLLDKNGKEIYESDKLKDLDGNIGIVEFDEGHFIIRHKNGTSDFIAFKNHFEVIGNIYGNPELI